MMSTFGLLVFITYFFWSVSGQNYTNHAAWYVGNHTAPPDHWIDGKDNGKATIVNRCNYPFYFWEARDGNQDASPTLLQARSKISLTIKSEYDVKPGVKCTDNCGMTYKLSKTQDLVGGSGGNQVQLEYSTRSGILYYDVSFVDCARVTGYREGDASNCPAWDLGMEITATSSGPCKTMNCDAGEMCIHDAQGAYYIDYPVQKWGLGEPVGTCPSYKAGTEMVFVLCSSVSPL